MGFFPADNPHIAILVILDEPQRDRWGGIAAAPVFKNIGEQILTSYRTPLRQNVLPLPEEELHETGVKLVSAGSVVFGQPTREADDGESVMPDFRGITIRDVLKIARERGIAVKALGSGWAVSQEPAAGTPIGDFPACTVSFEN